MREFTVTFERNLLEDGEYVYRRPGASVDEKVLAQLRAELEEDPAFRKQDGQGYDYTLDDDVEWAADADTYYIRATFRWDGDLQSLRAALQESYDEHGISGFFNIER